MILQESLSISLLSFSLHLSSCEKIGFAMILLISTLVILSAVVVAAVVYAINEHSKQWAESEN